MYLNYYFKIFIINFKCNPLYYFVNTQGDILQYLFVSCINELIFHHRVDFLWFLAVSDNHIKKIVTFIYIWNTESHKDRL